jgi:hypothetical protein
MGLIGKSLKQLRAEHDALQTQIDAQASRLEGALVPTRQLVAELMPLTTELVALKRKIMLKTPRRELVERVKELERLAASLPPNPLPDDVLLLSELANIKDHLQDPSREPFSLKYFLILLASAAALVHVYALIADWLAR